MTADKADLDRLAADFANASNRVFREVKQSVSKGSLNVKKQLIHEARQSSHFKQISRSIGYELSEGTDFVEGAIGPEKERDASAGLLGAYWGWSKGGGSLPDPMLAADADTPNFLSALAKIDGVILNDP